MKQSHDKAYLIFSLVMLVAYISSVVAALYADISALGFLPDLFSWAAGLLPVYYLWNRGIFRKSRAAKLLYIALALVLLGVLARIQHWAGSHLMLLTGIIAVSVIYLIHAVQKQKKQLPDYLKMAFIVGHCVSTTLRLFRYNGYEEAWWASFFLLWAAYLTFYSSRHASIRSSQEIPRYNFDKLR
jgi:hypothetical protein